MLNDSPGDCQIRGKALPAGKGVLAPNEVALCANGHAFGVIKVVKKLSKCSQNVVKFYLKIFDFVLTNMQKYYMLCMSGIF